tara:strand:- start:36671 stop:41830 length:5160 start_codon:yes stop_codon:yes gene_type:complete
MKFQLIRILLISFTIFLLAAGNESRTEASDLYVGAATTSITPKLPVSLTGQMRTRIAKTVEREVSATVLALESQQAGKTDDYAIMVSCDLVCIRGGILEAVREKVAPRLKELDVKKIFLNATHTHTAPTLIEGRYTLPETGITRPKEYVDFASTQIANAIVDAWNSRVKGSAAWGLGHAVVAQNRRALYANGTARMYGDTSLDSFRGIEGYEDHGLEALFFWNDKNELLATAINVACPAQAVEGRSAVNADFWHPVREQLRKKYGENLHVLGWAGAAGDQVPRVMYRKQAEERMRSLAGVSLLESIAQRIVAGWEEAYEGAQQEKHAAPIFVHQVKTIALPKEQVSKPDCDRITREVEGYAKDPSKIWIKNWKQSVLDRYEEQQAGTEKPYQMELHTIRLGDIAIATNDFELFNDFGTQMKARSPALQTFVIQLCGPGSYVPTIRAIQGGSYSAIIESNLVGPDGGQELTEQTIKSINGLFSKKGQAVKPKADKKTASASKTAKAKQTIDTGGWRPLFNGKNLDDVDTVLATETPAEDPDRFVQVKDGVFHIYRDTPEGQKSPFGYFATKDEYSHFHLRLEYKWGTKKFAPRTNVVRDAGILYHIFDQHKVWPSSIECQIQEKDTGDLYLVYGTGATINVSQNGKSPQYLDPAAGGSAIFLGKESGVSRVIKSETVEKEGWNIVEVIVRGSESAEHIVNGKLVNRYTDLKKFNSETKIWEPVSRGKLAFQVEGAEILYRNIEIKILDPVDKAKPAAKVSAAEAPKPDAPPMSPEESLAAAHVRPGYELQLVAAEPLVKDPVAIAWGPDGRLWVAEMADYPYGMDGKGKPGGRIRCLRDTNGDGKYDQSTLFLDNISFPNGVMPWRDGILVTAAPEIFYAEDTNGDGVADKREVMFSGFLEGNQQLRVNGLRWGLDNWIYCASGAHHGGYGADRKIKSGKTGKLLDIGSRDFRFHPETGQLDPQSGPSQFGRNRDDWGNWFGEQNSHPLWHFVLDDRYLRRNPHIASPDPRQQLVVPRNPKVYPATDPQKRFHSFEHSGRYTSACSAMIYRDELLFPRGEQQHAFTCEPFHNLVQHNILEEQGVSFVSHRDPAEQPYDFFASEDRWTRPVMARTGPDGALWVVDMYRYMIEHPDWLTPEGREELKPFYRHGDDRGRIYRVVKQGTPVRQIPDFTQMSTPELVAALNSPNGIQRDLASQTLQWRNDAAAVKPLQQLVKQGKSPLARLQALCTLDGLSQLSPDILQAGLTDQNPGVRRQAIRLSEAVAKKHPELITLAVKLSHDADAKTRLQLAYSLGEWDSAASARTIAQMLMENSNDAYLSAAVLSSLNQQNIAGVMEAALAQNESPAAREIIGKLLTLSVAMKQKSTTQNGLEKIAELDSREHYAWQCQSIASVLDALKSQKSSLAELVDQKTEQGQKLLSQIASLKQQAREVAFDAAADQSDRIAAIALLGRDAQTREQEIGELGTLVSPQVTYPIQAAAVKQLGTFSDDAVSEVLLRGWNSHGPQLRSEILGLLISRPNWTSRLLDTIESGQMGAGDINASVRQTLAGSRDAKIKDRVKQLLANSGSVDRRAVLKAHQNVLALEGVSGRGVPLFKKHCATCHKLDNVGVDIGPNLRSLTDRKPASLLTSILDPSASVDGKYVTYIAVTEDGLTFTGMMGSETGNSITLVAQGDKKKTILRGQLEEIRSTGKSLMPDGLEKELTAQDLADLIAYLSKP